MLPEMNAAPIRNRNIRRQKKIDSPKGQPLPAHLNHMMGSLLSADFSKVRIHTKIPLAEGVQAMTCGNDVYFNENAYDPNSKKGVGLIAHELAHVVQQAAKRVENPYGGVLVVNDQDLEAEANYYQKRAEALFEGAVNPTPQHSIEPVVQHAAIQRMQGSDQGIGGQIHEMNDIQTLVLSGGGSKGLAYASALECLELSEKLNLKRVGGASAGALTAFYLSLGATSADLYHSLGVDESYYKSKTATLKHYTLKGKTKSILGTVYQRGRNKRYYQADPARFKKVLVHDAKALLLRGCELFFSGKDRMTQGEKEYARILLKTASDPAVELTFERLAELVNSPSNRNFFKHLGVVGTRLKRDKGQKWGINWRSDLNPGNASVIDASMASAAFPGLFPSMNVEGIDYVDGGIVNNLPISLFYGDKNKENNWAALSVDEGISNYVKYGKSSWPAGMATSAQFVLWKMDFSGVKEEADTNMRLDEQYKRKIIPLAIPSRLMATLTSDPTMEDTLKTLDVARQLTQHTCEKGSITKNFYQNVRKQVLEKQENVPDYMEKSWPEMSADLDNGMRSYNEAISFLLMELAEF